MRVLGVSCDFHDAAAAVVVDGCVVAAAEEERFSRVKHDASLPEHAIASCLAMADLGPDDLDRVVLHEKPLATMARLLAARQRRGPGGLGAFTDEFPTFLRHNLFIGMRLERALRRLGATRRPQLRFADHHLSHAAAAFYPSPYDHAAVLTIDGIGEWSTASIGRGVGPYLDVLEELRYPDSLGLLYSMVTEYCGFTPNDGEYKLMGLAPFGRPVHLDALEQLVELHEDGSLSIDAGAVGYWAAGAEPLERVLDRPAQPHGAAPGAFEADLARSVQVLTENTVLRMARRAHQLTGERSICLAGGVALNCVANGRLRREGPFEHVWVQPAAGDAGSAVGAALWLSHEIEGVDRPARTGDGMSYAMLGPSFEASAVARWLEAAGAPYRQQSDRRALAREVAAALDDGRFVGWFEGRMEFGPRALGHRSILADPRDPDVQQELNLRVKGRESFRPFAPAVLEEHAAEWFGLDEPAHYMVMTAELTAAHRHGAEVRPSAPSGVEVPQLESQIPACTHIDGSARVQSVPAQRADGFRMLLEEFEDRTGCPVLLNTSFNRAGEPIVCSPDDAVASARAAGLDLLVLEDCLVAVDDLPDEVPPGAWHQVPTNPAPPDTHPLVIAAAVALIAVVGPVARVATWQGRASGAVLAAVLAGAAGACWCVGARWWLRATVILAAGLAATALGGAPIGVWAAVGLVAADVVAFGNRPLPRLPAGHREALAPLAVLGATSVLLARTAGARTLLGLLLLSMVAVTAASMFVPGRLAALSHRIGRVAARVITRVAAALLGTVVVLAPWAWHRLLGVDPLRPAARPDTAWHRRARGDERPRDLWRRDGIRPPGLRHAHPLRAASALGLVAALGALAVFGVRAAVSEDVAPTAPVHTNTDPGAIPAAFEGEAWYPDYLQDISWLWRTSVAWDPLAPLRLRDVTTRHVNIVDGARVTWRAPECSCRRLRVWMYGGSTTFGLGQRDEHTIASAIARTAWRQGLAVDIDNRGVVGDHHWEEANRLAWDLATLPPPDMVVFLDGINDVQAVDRMRELSRQPLSFIKDDFWRNYLSVADSGAMDPRWAPDPDIEGGGAPPGGAVPTTVPVQFGSAEEVGRYVGERYETARRISSALARDAQVPAAWFWQPAIENRPAVPGEPPPNGREWSLARYRAAAAATGPEVHDISDALDGIEAPLYWDQFHTNERGAAVIGEAMFDVLEPQLRSMARGEE